MTILLKIVQWNNPQNAYFPHYIVGTYFFNIVAPEGDGHKNFNHWVRGRKNIGELLLEIHDPPIPKKMVASFVMVVNVVTQCLFPPNKCPNIRTSIHESDERLLYLALHGQSHNYIAIKQSDSCNRYVNCTSKMYCVLFLCIQHMDGCEPLISGHHSPMVGDIAVMAWSDLCIVLW